LNLVNILAGFADISLAQLALVAGVARFVFVVGGFSAYGGLRAFKGSQR
jgi:hypothetical protein